MKYYLVFLLTTAVFYGSSVLYGFSQDDFYFLLISRADSFLDILKFFSPWHQQGFPFYRPLGTQLYFWLFQNSSQAMHVFMLVVQSFSGYLVYRLIRKLSHDRALPWLVSISYTAAAAHFLSLFYIAATQQLLAAMFSFLSLNAFLSINHRSSFIAKLRPAIWLALALLSKESAVMVPAIAFLLYVFHQQGSLKLSKLVPVFTPYVLCTISYILLRYFGGLVIQSEYHPVIGPSLVSTLRWYYLFTFNAPELLLNYAGINLFVNYWRFIKDFGLAALINSLSSLLLAITVLAGLVVSLIRRSPLTRKQILLYFQWWLLGIILIIWFPDHRYPHYLDISLPAMLFMLYTLTKSWLRYLMFGLFLTGAFTGISLSARTHWTVGRARMADKAITYFRQQEVCLHDSLYFVGDPSARELSYTLSLENGPRVLCGDPDLKIYYLPSEALAKEGHGGTIPEGGIIIQASEIVQ